MKGYTEYEKRVDFYNKSDIKIILKNKTTKYNNPPC